MNIIHLDLAGKTARVLFKPLPQSRPKPVVQPVTKCGPVASVRILNGINAALDPAQLTPAQLLDGDPELNFGDAAGEVLDPDSLSTAYFDSAAAAPEPIGDFSEVDIVYDARGQEKERRPHINRKSNVNEIHPIKIGKRLPVSQALTDFVFKQIYQIVHEDGLQMEFLRNIATELHRKNEMAVLGAGPKGATPLVIRDKGSPYRAFLYGEIGSGENEGKYKLLLLLTDQELKRPEND